MESEQGNDCFTVRDLLKVIFRFKFIDNYPLARVRMLGCVNCNKSVVVHVFIRLSSENELNAK